MKKHIPFIILILSLFFIACSPDSPEKYFDVAVLNVNALTGFANSGDLREFESPSVKMSGKNGAPAAMKRSEVLNTKIQFVEANLEKLRGLKKTPETKEMLETSVALYEHVLAAYKKEYSQLAKLYDQGASKEKIQQQALFIENEYYRAYEKLFNKLITIGKSYAEKHDIKVNWRM